MTDVTNSRPAKRRDKASHHRLSRLPAFIPVPLRARKDGWTPLRQAEFLGMLAQTRSVRAAAAFVGMSRESAYRLRRKPGAGEFAAIWDYILDPVQRPAPKVTLEPMFQRFVQDRYRPILRGGKYFGTEIKPDKRAFLRGLSQLIRTERADRKAHAGLERYSEEKGASV